MAVVFVECIHLSIRQKLIIFWPAEGAIIVWFF